jgi:hypothetical protein
MEYFHFKSFLQSPEAEHVVGYVDLATNEIVHVCKCCRAEGRYSIEDLLRGFWFSHETWCPSSPSRKSKERRMNVLLVDHFPTGGLVYFPSGPSSLLGRMNIVAPTLLSGTRGLGSVV